LWFGLLTKQYDGEQINEGKMGETCSTYVSPSTYTEILLRNLDVEGTIKVNLEETGVRVCAGFISFRIGASSQFW
jgi:predicted Zn-dependent protease